jgi:hypothetical protein
LILAALIVGLLVWAVRAGKYAQALLSIASLSGICSCAAGAWQIHQDKLLLGVVLVAIGLAALLGAAFGFMRLSVHEKSQVDQNA